MKPHSTDLAKESSTDLRSAGLALRRAERLVALHHQDARSDALERDDLAAALLSAIEADVVGAEAGGEAGGVQELGVEARDLEVERAGALVPVEGEVAVDFLHAGGARSSMAGIRGGTEFRRRRVRRRLAARRAPGEEAQVWKHKLVVAFRKSL